MLLLAVLALLAAAGGAYVIRNPQNAGARGGPAPLHGHASGPQMRYRGFGRALRRAALHSSRTDYKAHYTAVGRTGVPVLLIWGKQDSTVSIAHAGVVRDGIPNLQYIVVDSAGHLPLLEQSALVHPHLLAFLAAHPREATP